MDDFIPQTKQPLTFRLRQGGRQIQFRCFTSLQGQARIPKGTPLFVLAYASDSLIWSGKTIKFSQKSC
jgi:hypothetical protein